MQAKIPPEVADRMLRQMRRAASPPASLKAKSSALKAAAISSVSLPTVTNHTSYRIREEIAARKRADQNRQQYAEAAAVEVTSASPEHLDG